MTTDQTSPTSSNPVDLSFATEIPMKTLAIIMGGGAGSRLFPLTKDRSKPAVPLAGKYRLVDIPISNCLNSGLKHIYVLTQFNSTSLHRHINNSYKFDHFNRCFVEILAAQQTPDGSRWYQGTADAVRQNLRYFLQEPYEHYLILSGDQLYRMDYRKIMADHVRNKTDITIATIPVGREPARDFGIMQTSAERRIEKFVEKPKDPKVLDSLRMPQDLLRECGADPAGEYFQASMGIYVFKRDVLIRCLDNEHTDFGKDIIPEAIETYKVNSYIFNGYWEDIGTIRAFFDANLDLTNLVPAFSFFDRAAPVYTHPRFLPASKVNAARIHQAIISDGCIISDAHIERCVIGVRSVINNGATIRNSIIMGADHYEHESGLPANTGLPAIGIGKNCVLDRCIIDKNARIGDGVVITPDGKPSNFDGDQWYVRDGIMVVPKNAVIPAGTWI